MCNLVEKNLERDLLYFPPDLTRRLELHHNHQLPSSPSSMVDANLMKTDKEAKNKRKINLKNYKKNTPSPLNRRKREPKGFAFRRREEGGGGGATSLLRM